AWSRSTIALSSAIDGNLAFKARFLYLQHSGECAGRRRNEPMTLEEVKPPGAREASPMTLDQLRAQVERGSIDTVLLVLTDMQGRLQGKRLTARHFLDEVAEHGAEGCNYLLAVDVDMNPVEGYEMASWERGYGDFSLQPH